MHVYVLKTALLVLSKKAPACLQQLSDRLGLVGQIPINDLGLSIDRIYEFTNFINGNNIAAILFAILVVEIDIVDRLIREIVTQEGLYSIPVS